MINLIGALLALAVGLLLSNFEFINIKQARIITILGWLITVLVITGDLF